MAGGLGLFGLRPHPFGADVAALHRSNALRALVEPEVLIPVRLNKQARLMAGLFVEWLAD